MRLYYGTYGHRLSGKLYVYWGGDNLRSGQQVVAPVTNKSGKTYNTMFTISRAFNEKNAQSEVGRLTDKGIAVKTIVGRDTLSLPGGQQFTTKKEWREDSNIRYAERTSRRLESAARESLLRNKKIPSDTTAQKDRLRSMINKKYEEEE